MVSSSGTCHSATWHAGEGEDVELKHAYYIFPVVFGQMRGAIVHEGVTQLCKFKEELRNVWFSVVAVA